MHELALLGGEKTVRTRECARKLCPGGKRAVREFLESAEEDLNSLSDLEGDGVVKEFERAFAGAVGGRHVLALSSGTAALHTALLACDVGPGDEVVTTPYAWGQVTGSILAVGATPVFADIEPTTFNLDHRCVAERVGRRTKAIVVVHCFGHPADMHELTAISRKLGLKLICDSAQALGAQYRGSRLGRFGDIVTYSLGRGKILTTGEGGMLATSNDELYQRAVLVSQHPLRAFREIHSGPLRPCIQETGLTYRMHPFAAALGLGQIPALEEAVARRRETCLSLAEGLRGIPAFVPQQEKEGVRHSFHTFGLTYVSELMHSLPRELVAQALEYEGVPVSMGPVRVPVHLREWSEGKRAAQAPGLVRKTGRHPTWLPGSCPVAERRCFEEEMVISSAGCWIGCSRQRMKEIADAFQKVWECRNDLEELCDRTMRTRQLWKKRP